MTRPLRIVLVANLNYGKYGVLANAMVDTKVFNGLVRGGHLVYPFSFRDVARYESPIRSKRFGVSRMNRRLVETCVNFEPDLVCFGHSESVTPEALAQIRERLPAVKMCLWYHDGLWATERLHHIHARLPYLDAVFVSAGGEHMQLVKGPNTLVGYFPLPVDPSIERGRSFASDNLPIDLLFCGRGNRSDADDRTRFIEDLRDRLNGVRFDVNGLFGVPVVLGSAYDRKLHESRMGLNYSRRNDYYMCSSGRLWQLTGNGLLTFTPRVPGMDRLFNDDEIVYFDGLDDLVEKVLRFHGDDAARRRVAEAGWERAHRTFGGERVCRYMIETVFGDAHSESYEWADQVL